MVSGGQGPVSRKVPELYGSFSGVTILFVSQERRRFKLSNLTVIFLFVTLKTCLKIGFPKQAVGFINGVDNVNWPPYRESKSQQMAFLARNVIGTFEKRAPGFSMALHSEVLTELF